VHRDAREAVAGAQVVVTDTWISMGQSHAEEKLAAMAPFQVNEALMAQATPEALFLHCLPAHRGEEVAAEVIDGPRSLVWQQAENRMPTEEALLLALIARRWEA
jgi:ornithine carbamoyltransferase